MSEAQRVFLLGLMGAGKSSVGRLIAADLGVPYLDNDAELQRLTGRTTLQWADVGEQALHDAEAHYASALSVRTESFVAGLAASIADRVELEPQLHATGFCCYLRAQPHTLAARVASDPARPWLGSDPETVLTEMFAVRDARLRELADVVIDTDDLRTTEIAAQLLRVLRHAE